MPTSITPIHIDNDLIVCIKPAGLLAVPGRGADKQDCLSARLAAEYGEVHIVHRLDQATSGLMVFARNMATLKHLHLQFANRSIHKAYEATVAGNAHEYCGKTTFELDFPLASDWPNRPKQKVDTASGKPSLTKVEVLSFDAATKTSRLMLTPITGRTHQLRVHLAHIGYPILGDALYGDAISFAAAPRLMLHAYELGFMHPITGNWGLYQNHAEFG